MINKKKKFIVFLIILTNINNRDKKKIIKIN